MKYIITDYVAKKRVNLILKELAQFKKKHPNFKILDVGCGNMKITNIIKNEGYDIKGLDKFTKNECPWMKQDPDYVMDARDMKFADNTFDAVIALEFIEHCDCIDEIKRILKPGGIFLCSTPTPATDWIRHILVALRLLENQDFEGHSNITDLKKIPLKIIWYKKMFLGTSQFGVFTK